MSWKVAPIFEKITAFPNKKNAQSEIYEIHF